MIDRRGGWLKLLVTGALLALVAAGCLGQAPSGAGLTEQQALDASWEAFAPNTSSHDRANWEAISVAQVQGSDVAELFSGEPAPGCLGPVPPANGPIEAEAAYWHVVWKPLPATALPDLESSPTAPPLIPEAFVREGQFLLAVADGAVVARRLGCIIY